MTNKLQNKRVVIIGGSSGIGFAIAKLALSENADIIIASRSEEKLLNAKNRLSGDVETKTIDILDEESIKRFFQAVGKFNHLQITASEVQHGPFLDLPTEVAKDSFASKFWGNYMVAKHAMPYINQNGSITLFSGTLGRRPISGTVIPAAINNAIEGLARALAVELAPLRVNCISPGLTQTELFATWGEETTKKYFADRSQKFLIKRAAQPEEIAEAAIFFMQNTFATGTILDVDGGNALR